MPSKRLLSKPCNCSKGSFQWREIKLEEDLVLKRKVTFYEALLCQNHGFQWGLKKNERILETCISIPKALNLDEDALGFFRSIFSSLWKGRLNIQRWNTKVLKNYPSKIPDKITDIFLQKGLIFKETVPSRNSLKKNVYIQLTSFGREQIKNKIGFISSEDQILLAKKKIQRTLQLISKNKLTTNQKVLFELLTNQLQKIKKDMPGWHLNDESIIIPRNSAKNPPKYLLITYGICVWLQIYRKSITLREISARSFQDSQIHIERDPSKVLDIYSRDIDSIINDFSGKECADLGLVLALDSFTFSGELILQMKDDNSIKIGGPSVSFSNLTYSNIKIIKLNAEKVLFIENFAVFAQLVLDNWAIENTALLIFIKGMGVSGHFRKSILKNIIKNNQETKYFVWLDYDLGGCNIYREIVKKLEIENIKIIKIPLNISIPFRKIPLNQLNLIKVYENSEYLELKNFAQFILENGKVEQEYLLEWYNSILDYNIKRD